jgi:hypothetical protein
VAWPKGFVAAPSGLDQLRWLARDHRVPIAAVVGLVGVALYYVIAWLLVGRDPRAATIVPRFHHPPGLTPAGARYISLKAFDSRALAAALVGLAVKGHVQLKRTMAGFVVTHRGDANAPLRRSERALLSTLFRDNNVISLNGENRQAVLEARTALRGAVEGEHRDVTLKLNKGWMWGGVAASAVAVLAFALVGGSLVAMPLGLAAAPGALALITRALWWSDEMPWQQIKGAASAGLVILLVWMGAIAWEAYSGELVVSTAEVAICYGFMLVLVGLYLLFERLLPAPTVAGRRLLDALEGYKLYLGVAEKDRLAGLDPREVTPDLFFRHLPYAIALDIEKAWSSRFASVLTAPTIAREMAGTRDGYPDVDVPDGGDGGWSWGSADRLAETLGEGLGNEVTAATIPSGSRWGLGGGGGGSSGGGGGGGSGW